MNCKIELHNVWGVRTDVRCIMWGVRTDVRCIMWGTSMYIHHLISVFGNASGYNFICFNTNSVLICV